ncbi:MAG: hypothetical protein K2L14_03305 [Duncaniella sp.]|nr:hypothetical protein [Duncaniella sp.]
MDTVKYNLKGVTVEQFAMLFEPNDENIHINVSVPVKTNYEERTFAVGANIQYTEDEKPFLVAEVLCHYEIEEACWKELSHDSTKEIVIPAEMMISLAKIAIGALRGVVCVKTENTPFSRYYMPLIELQSSVRKEDFVFPKF